jgi:hypothetical protein
MYKKIFFHSFFSGVVAAIAAIIYTRIYFFATQVDYSRLLNTARLIGLNIAIVFNFIFSILSFAAVIIPISLTLPLDIEFPELFPGLAVPMVLFPAVAWYTIRPFFLHTESQKHI